MLILGLDLAWGERHADGACRIATAGRRARVTGYSYPRGDAALLDLVRVWSANEPDVLLAVDAPVVVANPTGARPVDRLTHRLFHREHAACHPANLARCARPPRVVRKLRSLGFRAGVALAGRQVAEVFPHPALVRLLALPRIVKYKRGPIAARRSEFARLQALLVDCLEQDFSYLRIDDATTELLAAPWQKPVEDQVDALICALIGLWHWFHRGRQSEILGDLESGFILLPRKETPCTGSLPSRRHLGLRSRHHRP